MVYFDSDNPANPKHVNHVALAVDTGTSQSIQDVLKTKIRSESAKESILSEINKIYNKIELNIDDQNMKRVVMEARQKEILDKIDEEIKNV